GYDGSAVAQARLKDATSQLIGRFCLAAEGATRATSGRAGNASSSMGPRPPLRKWADPMIAHSEHAPGNIHGLRCIESA
ncbi:hypothetical protein AB0M64_31030, partial [Streptomyces sp. NPDC051771]|uniref:hypothetical protein n=1 Tax=Streptomyces sp. NPDC051771 TaxID=3154847 RepID=UPI0034195708